MTEAEKIEYIKVISEEKETSVISAFLTLATQIAFNKVFPFGAPNNDMARKVMSRYDNVICEITVYLINKRGAEGESAHSESTAERTYENGGVPDSIMKKLIPFCGVIS